MLLDRAPVKATTALLDLPEQYTSSPPECQALFSSLPGSGKEAFFLSFRQPAGHEPGVDIQKIDTADRDHDHPVRKAHAKADRQQTHQQLDTAVDKLDPCIFRRWFLSAS